MVRVLVVDDDRGIRSYVRDALEDAGYEVAEAPDGAVALEHLAANPEPMVVLLDQMMPRCDGIQVLRALAADPALASGRRFVAMTAGHMDVPDDVRHLLAAPVLSKPFPPLVIVATVEAAAKMLVPAQRVTAAE